MMHLPSQQTMSLFLGIFGGATTEPGAVIGGPGEREARRDLERRREACEGASRLVLRETRMTSVSLCWWADMAV